jgi:hypothetical protein
MQKKSISWLFFAASFCVMFLGIIPKAHAISAFSREHNTECTTCHTIFPELNEYGDVFLKNGFVWNKPKKDGSEGTAVVKGEGDPEILNQLKAQSALAAPQKQESVLGAPKKSEQIWLSGLPQTIPLSMAAALNASYNDNSNSDKVDFSTRALSLLAGGVFQDKLGFYLKYNLYSEGAYDPAASNTPINQGPPNASDLDEFYLVWRNTLGSPINLKIGRFRPQLSLWKKTNKTGISDFATTHLSIKNSTFTVDSPEDALEASAVLFNRLYLAGGLVDRNGQNNNEGYGHISVKIGGSDFHAKEPDIDLDKESIFDYMYLVVGAYAYSGRNSGTLTSNQRNNFFRGGVETDLVVMNARLKLAWAKLRDTNPDFSSHGEEVSDLYAVQGEYMLRTDMIAFCRYEYLEMNDGTVEKRYIPAISYSPIQNTKVTLEYQHVDIKRSSVNNDSDIALLGIRVAF